MSTFGLFMQCADFLVFWFCFILCFTGIACMSFCYWGIWGGYRGSWGQRSLRPCPPHGSACQFPRLNKLVEVDWNISCSIEKCCAIMCNICISYLYCSLSFELLSNILHGITSIDSVNIWIKQVSLIIWQQKQKLCIAA